MSLVLAAALAISAGSLPVCSWDRPGHNPFKGDTVAAVDRYTDIPTPVRAALKQRMAARQYDEVAAIRRDSIEGRYSYSELRDMHFGQGQVCRTVTRDKWAPDAVERGLVYCESGHCLIVPTVCRNVSRITRSALPPAAAAGPGGGEGPAAGTAAAPQDELLFDPPAAGPAPVNGPAGSGPAGRGTSGLPSSGGPNFATLSSADPAGAFMQPTIVASAPLWGGSFGGDPYASPESGRQTGLNPPRIDLRKPLDDPPPGLSPAPPFPLMAPVPEPSTYGLMLLGLGLLLIAARRRQPAPAPTHR
jgi:hypothetical protein